MTTEPTTQREAVARLTKHLTDLDEYRQKFPGVIIRQEDEDLRTILALLTPDSPALTALKLAAVEYSKTDLRDDWGKFCDAEGALGNAARAFAKEQREGADV